MLLRNLDYLSQDPMGFLGFLVLTIAALLLGITVHEFSHALVASGLGDATARRHRAGTLSCAADHSSARLQHDVPMAALSQPHPGRRHRAATSPGGAALHIFAHESPELPDDDALSVSDDSQQ